MKSARLFIWCCLIVVVSVLVTAPFVRAADTIPIYTGAPITGPCNTAIGEVLNYNETTHAFFCATGLPSSSPSDATTTGTKGVVTFPPGDFDCTAGSCSIDYFNGQAASATTKGFLSSTDWTVFNAKQAALPNVTNDAQLKRSAGDFSTFATKATPVSADVLLIEDSAAAGGKKAITVGSLPAGGSGVVSSGATGGPVTFYPSAGTTVDDSTGLTLDATTILTRKEHITPSSASISPLGVHNVIACDATAAARTYTLPAASGTTLGQTYRVINVTGVNACSFAPASGERLNGVIGGTKSVTNKSEEMEATLVDTGTPNWQVTSTIDLAQSVFGTKYLTIECVPDATVLTPGDGKCYVPVHTDFNGWKVISAVAYLGAVVSTSGAVTIDADVCGVVTSGIRCSGTNRDLFSTNGVIDQGEMRTTTGTAPVMNTAASANVLATDEFIRVNIDGAGTGAQGLYLTLTFRLP